MMNIVLDTNCLLMSLSRRSRYYPFEKSQLDKLLVYVNDGDNFRSRLKNR